MVLILGILIVVVFKVKLNNSKNLNTIFSTKINSTINITCFDICNLQHIIVNILLKILNEITQYHTFLTYQNIVFNMYIQNKIYILIVNSRIKLTYL